MWRLALALVVVIAGCGGDDTSAPVPKPKPEPKCDDPLALLLPDGACVRPGIAPEACAPGFGHDGEYRCMPTLPPDRCGEGQMALPGEDACHPVATCGSGKWGDIPVDAKTRYVDASYPGADSDGSEQKPFTTIGEAYTAAPSGGLIAIAAGSYPENLTLFTKPITLQGVCPEKVEIVTQPAGAGGCAPAALCIAGNAPAGTVVKNLAIRGQGNGIAQLGTQNVTYDGLWIHDTSLRGFELQYYKGTASALITGTLLEGTHGYAVLDAGTDVTVEGSVVRGTVPSSLGEGRGIVAEVFCPETGCEPDHAGSLTLRGSVVEDNADHGVFTFGSPIVIEGSVIRGTHGGAKGDFGLGVGIQSCSPAYGCDPPVRSALTLTGSLVEENHDIGVAVYGSDATIESTVVRSTLPRESDMHTGRGIQLQVPCYQTGCFEDERSVANVHASVVEGNADVGILTSGGDLTVDGVVVRDTQANVAFQKYGRGISIQSCSMETGCTTLIPSSATVTGSLVANNHDVGVFVSSSSAMLSKSVVRDTLPRPLDGAFGDGISVFSFSDGLAETTVDDVLVASSARAGLSSFGSHVSLGHLSIACAAIPLDGEPVDAIQFSVDDLGGNACGCPETTGECVFASEQLAPPEEHDPGM